MIELRDYLAGQALVAMREYLSPDSRVLKNFAKSCYKVADAMIEASKEKASTKNKED